MEDLIVSTIKDIQPGRLLESLIFLCILMWKIRPHLKKVEERMQGLENGLKSIQSVMKQGFELGEQRFGKIETRIASLEKRERTKFKQKENEA
jgi:hypothetical protein